MTSLDFLYIALGVGFIILVIFTCAMLLNLTLVLRDVTKITENVRDISDRLKAVVFEPIQVLSEMTAGFGFLHDIVDKIKARFDGSAEAEVEDELGDMGKKAEKGQKKGGFSIKKFSK